jgi:hypothetical protein
MCDDPNEAKTDLELPNSEPNNESIFNEGLKHIQASCDLIRQVELDEIIDSARIDPLLCADLNLIASTMHILLKNAHFHLMYINHAAVKQFVLNAMCTFITKQKFLNSKLELFAILEQLLSLEIRLESVEFRTSNVPASYETFFKTLSRHVFDLVNYNRENMKLVELNKLKSFLRVISYLLFCLPFDEQLFQILPSFLDFIFKDMNIVSFRLMLAIAVNLFNERNSTVSGHELFGAKLDLLRETHENALSFFKYNIDNSENLKSEFTRQTFDLFIKRLEILNKSFIRESEASSLFKNSESARRFLHLLVRNQKELSDLIQRKCSRLRESTVNHFCEMHFEFSDSLLRMEGGKVLLETEYSNSGILLAYELANITIVYAQADDADLNVDLRIKLISLLPSTICVLNKYDWSNEMQLPGSNDFWGLVIARWSPIGFRMVSMFCAKSGELGFFCHSFFNFICMLLSGTLSDRLCNRDYAHVLDLVSEEFLSCLVHIAMCYDADSVKNDLNGGKFRADVYPLIELVLKVLSHVPFTSLQSYFRFSEFFIKLFRFESRAIRELLRPNFELIIQKLAEFYANVDLASLSLSVRENVQSGTVELAFVFRAYFFDSITQEENVKKQSFLMIVRDDILRHFVNHSRLIELKEVKYIDEVVEFYF